MISTSGQYMCNEASTVSEDLQVICSQKIEGSIAPLFNTKRMRLRKWRLYTQNEEYYGSSGIKVAVSHWTWKCIMKGCNEALLFKGLLVRAVWLSNRPIQLFPFKSVLWYSQNEKVQCRNYLSFRPAYTFCITCICGYLPSAVVKSGKIILFGRFPAFPSSHVPESQDC